MGSLAIAYYLGCYGAAMAGLAFTFGSGEGRRADAAPTAGFRGMLISVLVGTAGLSFNYFQALSAAGPLPVAAVNFLSLLSIPGCVFFVPRFFASVRPHPAAAKILKASAIASAASVPLAAILAFGAAAGLPPAFGDATGFILAGILASALGYGTWRGILAVAHPEETARAAGRAWLATTRWTCLSTLLIAPLTILDDFLLLPRALGWQGVPGALPFLAASLGAGYAITQAKRGRADPALADGAPPDWPKAALTPRETEVARLLVSGYSYRMIADKLGISPATVKTHVLNAYGKTGAGNKIELLSFAERGGAA